MIDSTISTEFADNLGQIVVEAYKLIDEEPALASLSLTELRAKLDSEGLPIDVVIEGLSGLSESNDNFLDTFFIQVRPLLDEPNGLQILTDSIDDQSQDISEQIHQLLDKSVQSSQFVDKVGGGSGNMKHPWLAVGLTATGVGGTVGVMYRRKVSHLERLESRAVEDAESNSREVAKNIFRDQTHLRNAYKEGDINPVKTADEARINIIKDAEKYTDKEIEKLFEPFTVGAKARVEESLRGLTGEEKRAFKIKFVDKIVQQDAGDVVRKINDDPFFEFKGETLKEQEKSAIKAFKDISKKQRSELENDPDLLEKYFERKIYEPYREAFDKVAENKGKVILKGARTELDKDIQEALEQTVMKERAKALNKLANDLEEDFATLEIKVESRVDNLVEDGLGDAEDVIDGLEIDFT
jgi:hypothetical protein